MKKFLIKILIIFSLAFASYTVITVKDQNEACAACCECINWPGVAKSIANWGQGFVRSLVSSARDFISGFADITAQQMDETEEMLRALAVEQRGADVEMARAQGEIENASQAARRTMDYQEDQLDDMREHPAPSEQACFQTTMDQEIARARQHTEFVEAVERENDRRRDTAASGSRRSSGDVALSARLLEELQESCVTDENRGNMEDICQTSPDENETDAEEGPQVEDYLSCEGCTIDPDDEEELAVEQELQNPSLRVGPFSKAIEDDPDTQMAYLASVKARAYKNLDDAINRKLKAERSAADGGCAVSMRMVKKISRNYYGNPYYLSPEGVCPSESALRQARILRMRDPQYMNKWITDVKGNRVRTELSTELINTTTLYRNVERAQLRVLRRAGNIVNNQSPVISPVSQ